SQGDDAVLLGDFEGQQRDLLWTECLLVQVDKGQADLLRQRLHHLIHRAESVLDQRSSQRHPPLALVGERSLQLQLVNRAHFEENLAQPFLFHRPLCASTSKLLAIASEVWVVPNWANFIEVARLA